MEVFLASAVIFVLAVLGMSIGTIFGRSLKGSCRGSCGYCDHTVPHECVYGECPESAEKSQDDAD
jgi:hypothetical protein